MAISDGKIDKVAWEWISEVSGDGRICRRLCLILLRSMALRSNYFVIAYCTPRS